MINRRTFIKLVGAGGILTLFSVPARLVAEGIQRPKDPSNLSDFERIHTPVVRAPKLPQDGRFVPFRVELPEHPMDEDHYIKSIEIIDPQSVVKEKGIFSLTPALGRATVSTRLKMADGKHAVRVIAECSKHGKWETVFHLSAVGGQCKEN
ncbi:MAG: hypothetical protein M1510_06230 [Nitrospirae bacterium]|nr:hypothetical protein [Nitrospirota bacterium]MCL5238406.1 hypothetical protein [Nitrospirota bacterium]